MKKILIGLLFITTFANAQETEFKFNKERFTDFVVENVDGKTASELYKKTIDWISVTYKNPREVIKAQIENEYIRIEGAKVSMFCVTGLGMTVCSDARYLIEISLKDGKYKFDVVSLEMYSTPVEYSPGGWREIDLNDTSYAYKKNGDLKGHFKSWPSTIETEFNSLNISLKNFLKDDTIPSKKDW